MTKERHKRVIIEDEYRGRRRGEEGEEKTSGRRSKEEVDEVVRLILH